ncbi:MAG: TauD/TfdA dioxygenase family protein [Minwuia sp.]|uniref:TauD/TfdA dioxygenase family protein n=1 Tax=Minwuia sp. TaxID=2493630 RepID=UPI003A88CF13
MQQAEIRAPEASEIIVRPLTRTIGAEISGIDLGNALSAADRDAIRAALLAWKVVFFRDQDITTAEHVAFARNFGELEVHPFAPKHPEFPEILPITHDADRPGRENRWHSDVTWRQEPSLGSILRCIEAPEIGGDTLFADMYAAYDGLPDAIKEKIDGKVAIHDFAGFRTLMKARGVSAERIEAFIEQYPNPEHPVVRTHPETGRRGIYVNGAFTTRIVGMEPEEGAKLLEYLYAQAATPEYQVRFSWRDNSIAFWDNRACQHYAVSDYWPAVRRMERATVIGDRPYFDPARQPAPSEWIYGGHVDRRRKGDFLPV